MLNLRIILRWTLPSLARVVAAAAGAAADMVAADMEVAAGAAADMEVAAAAVVTTVVAADMEVAAAAMVVAAAAMAAVDIEKQLLIPDNLHWYIHTSPSVYISRRHKRH